MANRNDRHPANVPGAYYVDDTCTDCDLCRSLAPQFFLRHEESGSSYVHRQPVTPEEVAAAEEALRQCPTDTIGNDGTLPPRPQTTDH
ncbi:MAG: ferredoxin [Verrucomicrobia bacterium]|nr:ferredoxin [Verrucomicrobiota bacterium]